jgi:cell division protein FtsI (penicillin-binding protein 3)
VGVGLPGEAKGMLDRPEQLDPLRRANIAFGQGVAVSLLQLAGAYLCVANDGRYLQPYLVRAVEAEGDTVFRHEPTARPALRSATALRLKRMLRSVVCEGTGPLAAIPGTQVCGKTGTAQKLERDPLSGRMVYSQTKSLMSFVGFFPEDEPEYVVAVMIDEPVVGRFASTVACPTFREIGQDLLGLDQLRAGQQQVALGLPEEEELSRVASR